MFTEFFAKGLIIGFSIAAPVGPIGLLCIQRTLAYGRLSGFASGLGAATADALYGFAAAFGLAFISSFLVEQQLWLRIIGGAFLLWMAYRSFTAKPPDPAVAAGTFAASSRLDVAKAYGSTIALTLANPTTILSFVAVFAGLGVGTDVGTNAGTSAGIDAYAAQTHYGLAATLVLGVFTGSALWWLILSGVAGVFRGRVASRHMMWINRVSGVILLAFGCLGLAGAFFEK